MSRRSPPLAPAELAFCERAARIAFSNPFSEGFHEAYKGLEAECAGRLKALEANDRAELRHYTGKQHAIMRMALLFDAYQQYSEPLDELVLAQIQSGEEPVPVPFARELLSLLERRGFEEEESLRVLAIFFQIRRAHHFTAGDEIYITAGTLDKPTGVKTAEHIFVASKSDYYDITDGLPQKDEW